jgi:hypothetical protein
LSQADEEVEEVPEVPAPLPGTTFSNAQQVQSPDALIPHPAAQETDPFFSTQDRMSRDERDQKRNPTGSVDRIRVQESPERSRSPAPSVQWTAGVVSAHSMHGPGPVQRRGSSRSGSIPPAMRRKMSRADSGREFWGLPEEPKWQRISLPEEPEDSSDEELEEDEEWVCSQDFMRNWAILTP